ncbi:hypothetical protein NW762_003089 [Fusarium torreyae]|uniref:Uncharacterized protein n=1 Tax=Fusarium torreyae TaxID=1237075 RepID=A0A9W8VIK8_9HYPO|nr:hypothetical protein NW762_003089 [Fusarium torreyae]
MSFIICCITALFTGITSATIQPFPRAANSSTAAARIVLGNSENVYIVDFFPNAPPSSLSLRSLDKQVPGVPSWMVFTSLDQLYAVNETSSGLRHLELDLDADQLRLKREREASTGVVHLAFNKYKTHLVRSAYGEGTVDV